MIRAILWAAAISFSTMAVVGAIAVAGQRGPVRDGGGGFNGTLASDLVCGGYDITGLDSLFMVEKAAADADVAGSGQLWVKTATPNQLWFTDDAGTDVQLGVSSGLANVVEDVTPQLGGTLDCNANDLADVSDGAVSITYDDDLTFLNSGSTAASGRLAWIGGGGSEQVGIQMNSTSTFDYEFTSGGTPQGIIHVASNDFYFCEPGACPGSAPYATISAEAINLADKGSVSLTYTAISDGSSYFTAASSQHEYWLTNTTANNFAANRELMFKRFAADTWAFMASVSANGTEDKAARHTFGGEIYLSANGSATTSAATPVWQDVAGTWSSNSLNNFTASGNDLIAAADAEGWYQVDYGCSFSGTASTTWQIGVSIDGADPTGACALIEATLDAGGNLTSAFSSCKVQLADNDATRTLELQTIETGSNSNSMTGKHCILTATQL